MRKEITHHYDGHGLNDDLLITFDDQDHEVGGGASHYYSVSLLGLNVARIQFQHGPRYVEGSKPGITDAVLLAIVLDRYEGFQSGPYACRENALVLTKLQEAMHWMKHRADERARRGVLGTLNK